MRPVAILTRLFLEWRRTHGLQDEICGRFFGKSCRSLRARMYTDKTRHPQGLWPFSEAKMGRFKTVYSVTGVLSIGVGRDRDRIFNLLYGSPRRSDG